MVCRIIAVHLELRNALSVRVPHNLSDDDKRRKVGCCQDILSMFNIKAMSFTASHYVVEDESWFVWDQKEHRNAWIEKNQTKPTVARAKMTKRKPMLLVAITCKPQRYRLILLPPGHTVNSDVTIQLLKDTKRRFSQVRRNPIALRNMALLWDNARLHICIKTTTFLKQAKIQQLKQSPHSPDLNICDRFLFRKLKSGMKGVTLGTPDEVMSIGRQQLDRTSERELVRELEKLRDHCNIVIQLGGDYPSDI